MLTIFAIPKPFQGHVSIIQRNAIQSWTKLHPDCEVILLGDEPGTGTVAAEFKTENDSLYAYERVALENALKKTGNNRRQAAALLGIAEATLYRKLKQFNLS